LSSKSDYSKTKLQFIVSAWVMSALFDRKSPISADDGDVEEEDYDKQSIYSLLYSIYRSIGVVRSQIGEPYEFTFNTWGYAWPDEWGESPTSVSEPERFGRNAYSGLLHFEPVKKAIRERDGSVHIVEMGCGTGAGAHHICQQILPKCTYQAVDMQQAAIRTCQRKFVPEVDGRLVATCADCTQVAIDEESADFVIVCETHVTEQVGRVTDEDEAFFGAIRRVLKMGGYLLWGNAIPDSTWQPCFDYLESIGMKLIEVCDVTSNAIQARVEDEPRVEEFVRQCLDKFVGFRIPFLGHRRRAQAEIALKNFYRNPGTYLNETMHNGRDSYKVVLVQKA